MGEVLAQNWALDVSVQLVVLVDVIKDAVRDGGDPELEVLGPRYGALAPPFSSQGRQ